MIRLIAIVALLGLAACQPRDEDDGNKPVIDQDYYAGDHEIVAITVRVFHVCDRFGRAVYHDSSAAAIFVVDNAPECQDLTVDPVDEEGEAP